MPSGAVRPTRGKTVGRALISSFLHDYIHRADPKRKPLYTQAQFNRMVEGLKSEQEHRVYLEYVNIYNGLLEEHMRAEGFYQQAQHGLLRVHTLLRQAQGAQRADAILAQFPVLYTQREWDEQREIERATRRAWRESYSGAMLRALDMYTAFIDSPALLPQVLRAPLKDFLRKRPHWREELAGGEPYQWLGKHAPTLRRALEEALAAQGLSMPDDPFAQAYTMGQLADLDIPGHAEAVNPVQFDPLRSQNVQIVPEGTPTPARDIRALFCGLTDIFANQDLRDELSTSRILLLLPALSRVLAYNQMIDLTAVALHLPELPALKLPVDALLDDVAAYNADRDALQAEIEAEPYPDWRKATVLGNTFARIEVTALLPSPVQIDAVKALLADSEQRKPGVLARAVQLLLEDTP